MDSGEGVITAYGDVNINTYASLYYGFYLNTGITNGIQSTAGSVIISSKTAASSTSYYGFIKPRQQVLLLIKILPFKGQVYPPQHQEAL